MEKIDIFNHIFPEPFHKLMMKVAGDHRDIGKRVRGIPMLADLDERFRVMDRFGADYRQVLSLPTPPLEALGEAAVSIELAKAANDGMAELVRKYPDRFPSFVASLPLNAPDAGLAELQRAIDDLGACGVQIYTNMAGKPLTAPKFRPLFAAMTERDRPIWLHPTRDASFPDYLTEDKSKYEIWWTFGWPYETSVTMARIVFEGLFDQYPELKIITHHLGGMVPYFEGRVGPGWDQLGSRTSDEDLGAVLTRLKKRPIEYFRMFYADTAVFGGRAATICGLNLFGVDKVLFASDSPFDPEKGPMYIRETIKIINELNISDADREKIYRGNAVKLLKLKES